MADDYRNTRYCPILSDMKGKKQKVVDAVKIEHPKAIDIHTYISRNDEKYKLQFMKIYNKLGTSSWAFPRRLRRSA